MILSSVDLLTSYLPAVGAAQGIAPVTIGLLLGLRGAVSVASRLLLDSVGRSLSASTLITWSTCGSVVAFVIVEAVSAPTPLTIAMVVGGFFLGMAQPLTMTAVAVSLTQATPPRGSSPPDGGK